MSSDTRVQVATVVRCPPETLFVDEGRSMLGHWAVSPSGAYDRRAWQLANLRVGNAAQLTAIEFNYGTLEMQLHRAVTLAITGISARIDIVQANGIHQQFVGAAPITLPAHSRLVVHPAQHGLRGYLAIAGGWHIGPVLGSASFDTLARLGPAPLQPGTALFRKDAVTSPSLWPELAEAWSHRERSRQFHRQGLIPVLVSPWSTLADLRLLCDQSWRVAADANRVGMRLTGNPLPAWDNGSAASQPMIRGAIQVPPDGQPVILGPDHPTTGGYWVIGVITAAASDQLAQVRPGDVLRFQAVTPA